MEEIDIVELFKRVKEGKIPKKIQIGVSEKVYELVDAEDIGYMYALKEDERNVYWFENNVVNLDTKITILDKPIIEELDVKISGGSLTDTNYTLLKTMEKVNEIIKAFNIKEKKINE